MRSEESRKRLIVNADDFGLDERINSGIIRSFKNGIVRSASLAVSGEAFDAAVHLTKSNRDLSVGIHLVINEERPVLPEYCVKSLTDKKGNFLTFPDFLKKYSSRRIDLSQVYSEFDAQIEKFIKTGLMPTHIDSHKHIHMIPGIFNIVFELAKKYKISGMRLSRCPVVNAFGGSRRGRALSILALSGMSYLNAAKLKAGGLKFTKYCYGLMDSGSLNCKRLDSILTSMPAGTYELMCHPGVDSAYLRGRFNLDYNWNDEVDALTNPGILNKLNSLNIGLVKYEDI